MFQILCNNPVFPLIWLAPSEKLSYSSLKMMIESLKTPLICTRDKILNFKTLSLITLHLEHWARNFCIYNNSFNGTCYWISISGIVGPWLWSYFHKSYYNLNYWSKLSLIVFLLILYFILPVFFVKAKRSTDSSLFSVPWYL